MYRTLYDLKRAGNWVWRVGETIGGVWRRHGFLFTFDYHLIAAQTSLIVNFLSTSFMSQTNPRKPGPRNGTDSPGPDAPTPTTPAAPVQQQQVARHPLPQHPHTHIPAHLKQHRGGRPFNKTSTPAAEESPELKALREKYGGKLGGLKEMFPNWNDEDLLSVLAEVNGNVDTAAGRIAEGV